MFLPLLVVVLLISRALDVDAVLGAQCLSNQNCGLFEICFMISANTPGMCIQNPLFPNPPSTTTSTTTTTTTTAASPSQRCGHPSYTYFSQTNTCYAALGSRMTFQTASALCNALGGGFVAEPKTPIENLYTLLAYSTRGGTGPYYIGLRKLFGTWYWPSRNSTNFFNIVPATFTSWRPSQPDGCCGVDVTCVISDYTGQNGLWDDTGCDFLAGVVCQVNPV